MPTLVYSSRLRTRKPALIYTNESQHYQLASRLIDAIFKQKDQVVVERDRFTYVPSDGTRKMVIRLKRLF